MVLERKLPSTLVRQETLNYQRLSSVEDVPTFNSIRYGKVSLESRERGSRVVMWRTAGYSSFSPKRLFLLGRMLTIGLMRAFIELRN